MRLKVLSIPKIGTNIASIFGILRALLHSKIPYLFFIKGNENSTTSKLIPVIFGTKILQPLALSLKISGKIFTSKSNGQ